VLIRRVLNKTAFNCVLVKIASPCQLKNFPDVSTHMLTFVEPGLTSDTVL